MDIRRAGLTMAHWRQLIELVELFRSQRSGPHAHMNWQRTEQLDIEFILNARAWVIDPRTVRAAGWTFSADALVLCTGSRTAMPGIPGVSLRGVFDYASFIEELDYEPALYISPDYFIGYARLRSGQADLTSM